VESTSSKNNLVTLFLPFSLESKTALTSFNFSLASFNRVKASDFDASSAPSALKSAVAALIASYYSAYSAFNPSNSS